MIETQNIERLYLNDPCNREAVLAAYRESIAEKGIDAPGGGAPSFGEELAILAASYADAGALALLFEAGVNPLFTGPYAFTLLHHAAKMGCSGAYVPAESDIADTVNLLLDKKVSALRKDENENLVCYHYAARNANHVFVETLAARGAKLNIADRDGNTGIHIAADYSYSAAHMVALIEKQKKTYPGQYPADSPQLKRLMDDADKGLAEHAAKLEDYYKTVRAFLKSGQLDGAEKNSYGADARTIAVDKGAKKIAALLEGALETDGESDPLREAAGGMTIFEAIIKEDHAALDAIIKLGVDLNALCGEKNSFENSTALGAACAMLDNEAAEILLQAGADPNYRDGNGKAALAGCFPGSASMHGGIFKEKRPKKLVKAIIDHGFDINSFVNNDSDTMFNLTCKTHGGAGYNNETLKTTLLNEFLKYDADVNIPNNAGGTPLMYVCGGDFDILENIQIALLEGGADANAKDRDGNTPLHYAAGNNSRAGAKTFCDMLLEFGADINAVNNAGKSALDIATENDNEELVKLLLRKM
ncbi:MAG: ankyrin repeat domain-containing protein [Treponema sp.]|jgi:ankyrin repeat protein|nr:ankyrin repeat domain-containing protein [Treponema sp.]